MKSVLAILFFVPSMLWAQAEFVGRYTPVLGCKDWGNIELIYDENTNTLHGVLESAPGNRAFGFEQINKGKRKFNTCWSNGVMGHIETTFKNSFIETVTTYLRPRIFCIPGKVDSQHFERLTLKGRQLIFKEYWIPNNEHNRDCTFEILD